MKQKDPRAAFREVVFHLADSAGNALTGKTFSGAEIQIRKPGASAYANADSVQQAAVVEIGGGDYVYTCTTGEFDTAGPGWAIKVNKAGALVWTLVDAIVPATFVTAATGTLTSSIMTSDRAEADGCWNDVFLVALTGALAGQVKRVGSSLFGGGYVSASGKFTLATGQFWTAAPVNGDVFEIVNR